MNVIVIAETFLAFVIAVTLHEAAHAAMALVLGDGTPREDGRLSVNPRRQMASIGTIVAIAMAFGPIPAGLGWGKPVETDGRRLRVGQDLGIALVALAGPVFSLIMGLLFSILLRFAPHYLALNDAVNHCDAAIGSILQTCLSQAQPIWQLRLEQFLFVLASTNILLALANLIPLYPFDGYYVLFAFLPNDPAVRFRNFRPYMELTLLIIFFVIPYLAAFLRLPLLNPGYWLANWSVSLASNVTGAVYQKFVYFL
jgi:Zn-dependent protease